MPEPEVDADETSDATCGRSIDGERYRLAEALGATTPSSRWRARSTRSAGFLDTLLWVLAAAGAVALGAALLLGPWVARATLRPVERMTRTARTIAGSPRDLSTRVEPAFPDPRAARVRRGDERDARESIATADRHQRRFVADASHELRTPLTSLGGNADLPRPHDHARRGRTEALGAVGATSID